MPASMIHLLTSRALVRLAVVPMTGRFLLGSLAPDAVILRNDASREDRYDAHLHNPDWQSAWKNALELAKESRDDGFMMGACTHIMTDYLWLAGPCRSFRKSLEEDDPAQTHTRYAQEMEQLDRMLFRQEDSQKLWAAAMAAQPQDFSGLVTAAEVDRWRKERYQILRESKPMEPPQLFTAAMAQKFVDDAASRIARELA